MSGARRPVVGIIGGMGPDATVELMRRVILRTPADDDGDHLHMIAENDPTIPSRLAHLLSRTGPDPTPALVRIARNLEAAGATLLAMPCNTAHAYAAAIRAAVGIPLLDMVGLTVSRVVATASGRRVGLLASTAVHEVGLYAAALGAHGLCVRVPAHQDAVMDLIRGVKRGDAGAVARRRLQELTAGLAGAGDVVLVACTELSVLATGLEPSAAVVDSLDVLAAAILASAGKGATQ